MRTMVIFVMAAAVMAAALPAQAGAAPVRAAVGMISLCEGKAAVEAAGQSRDALAGEELFEGDTVVTGPGAKVRILFRDDSLVTVAAETRIEVSAYAVDPASKLRKSVLTIARGKVLSLVSRVFSNPASMFEVKTRTAVAGVRGTRFIVEAGDAGDRVATLEGSVAVRKTGATGEVVVAAGSYSDVNDAVCAAVAMSGDMAARLTGDLQKIDKTPAYAMNLGTLSSNDLIGGAEAADGSSFGSQSNGRVSKSTRGSGGGTTATGESGDKGGPATGDPGMKAETGGTPDSRGATDGTGAFNSPGGTGQIGTNGTTHINVTITLPTTPLLLKRR